MSWLYNADFYQPVSAGHCISSASEKASLPYTIGLVVIGMALGVAAEYLQFLRPLLGVELTGI